MASTRAATGHSKPRVFAAISTEPGRKTTTGKKSSTKATAGKPAAKKTAAGRVTKPKTQKRKPTVKDKVEGAAKKAEGAVTGNAAKKAAGTKQAKGTDGKRARKVKV